MTRAWHLVLATASVLVATSGCAWLRSDAEPTMCTEDERQILLETDLTPNVASEAFELRNDEEVFVGLLVDPGYTPGALPLTSMTSLHWIDADDQPSFRESSLGGSVRTVPADPPFRFGEVGDYQPLEAQPGRYRIWSPGRPKVVVVACTE